jgi:hypothetical protein
MESPVYFKICGDLEEVAITKSVPNWILYLHKFFLDFYSLPSYFSHAKNHFQVLFSNPENPSCGAHLSVAVSPGVGSLLAVLGGVVL